MRTVEIQYGDRANLGKFFAISIYDLLAAKIDQMSADNLHACSIVCVAADGQAVSLSMAEVHPALSQSPARLLLSPAEATQRGEVVLQADVETEFDDGSIDFGKLAKITDPQIRERLFLPHLTVSRQDAQDFAAAEMLLMTTNDVQTHRWIANVAMVYIIMPG